MLGNCLKVGGLLLKGVADDFKPPWQTHYPLEDDIYYLHVVGKNDAPTVKDISVCILLEPKFRFGHIFVYRGDGVPVGRLWFRRERIATDYGVCDLGDRQIEHIIACAGQDGRADFYIKLKE